MNATLDNVPGTKFVYSDINFITLGAIVEKITGEALDVYAQQHIFTPLGMTHTRYLPFAKSCGEVTRVKWRHPANDLQRSLRRGIADGSKGLESTAPTQHA